MRSRLTYLSGASAEPIISELDELAQRHLPESKAVVIGGEDDKIPALRGGTLVFEWDRAESVWTIESTWPVGAVRINKDPLPAGKTHLDFNHCLITCELTDGTNISKFKFWYERSLDAPMFQEKPARSTPIPPEGLIIGRGSKNRNGDTMPRICLDRELRRLPSKQAEVRRDGKSYIIVNCNNDPTLRTAVNGSQAFESHNLIFGDCIQIPEFDFYTFQFDGNALVHVGGRGRIQARGLGRRGRENKRILIDAGLDLPSGAFIGILGGSGQGKTTLMKALCGLNPASEGGVWIDGRKITGPGDMARVGLGYVPQEDIVHRELTVRRALVYGARLRVQLPRQQLEDAIDTVLRTLDLTEHQDKPVRVLSGGQCKRVSIASELVMNPRFLFLDEPTSGLDPATEQKLMAELQRIAKSRSMGVLCTTHVLQNSYLFTSVLFIQGGRVIFQGSPRDAAFYIRRTKFGQVTRQSKRAGYTGSSGSSHGSGHSSRRADSWGDDARLLQEISEIYGDVSKEVERREKAVIESTALLNSAETPSEAAARELQECFEASDQRMDLPPLDKPDPNADAVDGPRRPAFLEVLGVLLARQGRIMLSDPLNYLFLLAQALVIGGLVGWVSDNLVFQMFITVIATLWFGCSNGAQQIVGEMAIFRRERLAGVGLNAYLVSKFLYWIAITFAQSMILFFTVLCTHHLAHHLITENQEKYDPVEERRLFVEAFFGTPDGHLPDDPAGKGSRVEDEFKAVDALDAGSAPSEPSIQYRNPARLHVDDAQFGWLERLSRFFRIKENMLGELRVHRVSVPPGAVFDPGPKESWSLFLLEVLGFRLVALLVASACGVGLGLLVSSSVRSETQAVMWVPLILIPQILFGSFVVTLPEMDEPVRWFSQLLPSYNVQQLMDIANLYGREIPRMTNKTKIPSFIEAPPYDKEAARYVDSSGAAKETYERLSQVSKSWQNLVVLLESIGQRQKEEGVDSVESRRDVMLTEGMTFKLTSRANRSGAVVGAWIALSYALILWNLARKQTA